MFYVSSDSYGPGELTCFLLVAANTGGAFIEP